jgi:hypothetical protein
MVSITLSVPEDMKEEMDEFPEINWSEIARQSIEEKIRDLKFLREFKKHSDLTDEEAVKLGRKLNQRMQERYEE